MRHDGGNTGTRWALSEVTSGQACQAADPRLADAVAAAAGVSQAAQRPKLVFLATEDWYFWSDRLPVARALRDAGCAIAIAAREQHHGDQLRAEGFAFHPLAWRRRGDGVRGAARALRAIVRLYRRERPDLVNHLALKPILFGGLARRLAFRRGRHRTRVASIDWLMGFGAEFAGDGVAAALRRRVLGLALRRLTHRVVGRIVVQNPDDGAILQALGIDPSQIALIRGSGVDTGRFVPLPAPPGPTVTVALVSRMLRSKGVLDAAAAVRRLRAQGLPIQLVLAGGTDPDNRDSLDDHDLAALAKEPGIDWLGRVEDVRAVWRDAAIAVLPSSYGEGLPRALLEAAACARPIVATDRPGCREIVRDGATGLLVPPGDIAALANALAALAGDPARRAAMGLAGRALVEREFSEARVIRDTLALYEAVLRERDVAGGGGAAIRR
jgi:glycosyltransferase involved in cell wall biosynthesis